MPAKPLTNLRWITFSNVSTGVLSAMASTVYTEGKIPPGVALLSVIMRQAIRQCLIAQEMNLQTGCIKAYASAVGKQITSKLGELAMEEAAQLWRFKDDVDVMVDKMQDLEAMLHDADDRLRQGGMDREVVGRSICSALHRPLDLHRPTLAARSAPPQKSTGTSSRGQCMCAATPEGRKGKVGAAPVEQGNGFTCSPVIAGKGSVGCRFLGCSDAIRGTIFRGVETSLSTTSTQWGII